MAGNDLASMSAETRAILTNQEVIVVDQDALGTQGRKVRDGGAIEVWMKPLLGGERAVLLFNRGSVEAPIAFEWEDVGFAPSMTLAARDLWAHKDLGTFTGRFEAKVLPHDVVMIRLRTAEAAAK